MHRIWIAYRTLRLRIDDLFRLIVAMFLLFMGIYLATHDEIIVAGILIFYGGIGVYCSHHLAKTRKDYHL